MTFRMPQEFVKTQPVLYTAWHFTSEMRSAPFLTDYNKLNYTPRLIFVRAGRCRFFFPDADGEVMHTGDMIYIPPSTVYHTQFFEKTLETYNLNFDFMPGREVGALFTEKFVRRIPQRGQEDVSLCEEAPCFADAPEFSRPFFLHAPDALHAAETIIRETETPAQFSQMQSSAMLSSLLVTLIRQARTVRAPRTAETYVKIVAYIESHIGDRLSGKELSAALHYHPYYMNRVVTEIAGESLHRFILHAKLRRARQMLCETNLPIGDIALRLAFCDASHFSRVFAAEEGISPARYRANAGGV